MISKDNLEKYDSEGITINKEELEENKTKIVNTLNNYKIGIESIKATIGPTVTLYEIVPEAGIRISKIKNLEKYLPFNSFARRNIGDLIAYKEGFEIVIRIDDDNYPTKDNFLNLHMQS